eukprot:gene1733-3351_t
MKLMPRTLVPTLYQPVNSHSFISPTHNLGSNALSSTEQSGRKVSYPFGSNARKSPRQLQTKLYMFDINQDDDDILPKSFRERTVSPIMVKGCIDLFEKNNNKAKLNSESLSLWEDNLKNVVDDIKSINSVELLLDAYETALEKASQITLDPLQLASFEGIATGMVNTLTSYYPPKTPNTVITDLVTDRHLEFIERFRSLVDDGGSDGYSQSARQEFLGYQLAGLVRLTYSSLNRALSMDKESAALTPDMRLNNWLSPVYARLQRRFVRFLASNVPEKLVEQMSYEVSPSYSLAANININGDGNRNGNRNGDESDESLSPSSSSTSYAPWELTNFINRLLRVISVSVDLTSVEAKVAVAFKSAVSTRMSSVSSVLERSWEQGVRGMLDETGAGTGAGDVPGVRRQAAEDMLNIGHSTVAAVLTLCNLVGLPDPEDPSKKIKEFLRPLILGSDNVLNSLPTSLRNEVSFDVSELSQRLQPSPLLQSAATVAAAIRLTAAEEYRSLVTYNTDQSRWPESRDAAFSSVLCLLLYETLTAPTFNERYFYENLIAMAALEEAIGTREPRVAVRALLLTTLSLSTDRDMSARPNDMGDRVIEVERALGMLLRLPEGAGQEFRIQAFRDTVNELLSEDQDSMKRVMDTSTWMAQMLDIQESIVRTYVSTMGLGKFDKAVGRLLLDADVARLVSGMGSVYLEQLLTLAQNVGVDATLAEERTLFLAAAVFQSIIETVLEASKKRRMDQVDTLLRKSFSVLNHPLLDIIKEKVKMSPMGAGVKMVVTRQGPASVADLLRLLDSCRQRLQAANKSTDKNNSGSRSDVNTEGWGSIKPQYGGMGDDDDSSGQFVEYIAQLQTDFMKEYAAASLKRSPR